MTSDKCLLLLGLPGTCVNLVTLSLRANRVGTFHGARVESCCEGDLHLFLWIGKLRGQFTDTDIDRFELCSVALPVRRVGGQAAGQFSIRSLGDSHFEFASAAALPGAAPTSYGAIGLPRVRNEAH